MRITILFFLFIIQFYLVGCHNHSNKLKKPTPNVILIMADDIGFESLGINGATDFKTPFLDSLAKSGINFTNAYSQPLCTPSRVKIMTGKPNYLNYESFTYLNPNQKTFGNLFKENGYKTAIAGKWQLNGVQFDMEDNQDLNRPHKFGFDEYSLWWLAERGERFADPNIFQNGSKVETTIDDYGPDVFTDFIIEFINKNKNNPFFVYYPMALVHDPFRPTPDSNDWKDSNKRNIGNNPIYFGDMVTYMDKIIARISNSLKENDIEKNTLLIFVGDNGTDQDVVTLNSGSEIPGSKGGSVIYSSNVPMIINWTNKIKQPFKSDVLIDFTDFYATFEDILNIDKKDSYGKSFLPLINDSEYIQREVLITYYNPMWSTRGLGRGVYAQNKRYKLYKDGSFFDYLNDPFELKKINVKNLRKSEINTYNELKKSLDTVPDLPNINHNNWKERLKTVRESNKFDSNWRIIK